jgi:hypothetical protein
MKILVERDLMVELATMLEQMIRNNPRNKEELQRRLDEIDKVLANNPEPTKSNCKICGIETNSNDSWSDLNYCPRCWNQGLANKHIKKNWRDLPSPPRDSRERVQ